MRPRRVLRPAGAAIVPSYPLVPTARRLDYRAIEAVQLAVEAVVQPPGIIATTYQPQPPAVVADGRGCAGAEALNREALPLPALLG